MDEKSVYAFLLDLFPLTEDVRMQDLSLFDVLRRKAIELLLAAQADYPCRNLVAQIEVLVMLCCDLGYIDEEVRIFLLKGVEKLADDID